MESATDVTLWPHPLKPTGGGPTTMTAVETTSSPPPPPPSSSMTDSGVTHTIPNHSVVTVVRHTTVVTGATPTSAPAKSSASSKPTRTSLQTSEPAASNDRAHDASTTHHGGLMPISTGAIAGIAVGALLLIALAFFGVFIMLRIRKSKKEKQRQQTRDSFDVDYGEEKHLPDDTSPQLVAGVGGVDPFAPFGGRADVAPDPYRPRSGAFEMDADGTARVELPVDGSPPNANKQPLSGGSQSSAGRAPLSAKSASDPRATLNNAQGEDGKPVYVNQWSQWGR